MRNGRKALIGAATSVVVALMVMKAEARIKSDSACDNNPYTAIASRNIFDLHDSVTNRVPEKPAEPSANVRLTGITTFTDKLALMIVNEPGKAGKPATSHSLILGEGQRSGTLEVLEINPKARTVKIKNDEIECLLCFDSREGKK